MIYHCANIVFHTNVICELQCACLLDGVFVLLSNRTCVLLSVRYCSIGTIAYVCYLKKNCIDCSCLKQLVLLNVFMLLKYSNGHR